MKIVKIFKKKKKTQREKNYKGTPNIKKNTKNKFI